MFYVIIFYSFRVESYLSVGSVQGESSRSFVVSSVILVSPESGKVLLPQHITGLHIVLKSFPLKSPYGEIPP